MITNDMTPNINFHLEEEKAEIVSLKKSSQSKQYDSKNVPDSKCKGNSYYQKYIKNKSKDSTSTADKKKKPAKTIQISFDAIIEENDWVIDDEKEKNGPSYLTAIKYASECKKHEDKVMPIGTTLEEIQEEKIYKIKAYRAYMKSKATANSRNFKKENDTMKKGASSKTGSGIGGASTRESQNL